MALLVGPGDGLVERLADANHLTSRYLDSLIATGRHHYRDRNDLAGRTPLSITRLAALTSRSEIALRRALPGLQDVTKDGQVQQTSTAETLIAARPAPACRLCAARRGVFGLAIQHTFPHQRICLHHGRWHGGGPQRPLHAFPEVLSANLKHRRLASGPFSTLNFSWHHREMAAFTADWLTADTGPTELRRAWSHRLKKLGEDPYGPSADRIELITYPETVTLTDLAADKHARTPESFLLEASHRLSFNSHNIHDLIRRSKMPPLLRNGPHPSQPT